MSTDEALEKWLDAEVPEDQCGSAFNRSPRAPAEPFREIATAAWHAAVKHTLAYVAGEVNKDADEMADDRDAELERGLAIRISKMKP